MEEIIEIKCPKCKKMVDRAKVVKEKYVKVMQSYKEGFTALAEGCETQIEDLINAGAEGMSNAVDLLDEYNIALEELAKKHGATIEY